MGIPYRCPYIWNGNAKKNEVRLQICPGTNRMLMGAYRFKVMRYFIEIKHGVSLFGNPNLHQFNYADLTHIRRRSHILGREQ